MNGDAVYDSYSDVLSAQADLPVQDWTFKRDPTYCRILEHVSPAQGVQYLEAIRTQFPDQWARHRTLLIEIAKRNDSVGAPLLNWFDELEMACSPTNVRYMLHALLITAHIQQLKLGAVDIVELGGGYGGLALYLLSMTPLLSIASCTIVDLPSAGKVQALYAQTLHVPLQIVDGTNVSEIDDLIGATGVNNRFLISNYGFSEFSPAVRDWYERTIIPHCAHGFMVWNMIPVYPFTTAPLHIDLERPETGPGNRVVTF